MSNPENVPQIQMASKQLRLGSWPLAYITSPIWSMALLIPFPIAQAIAGALPQGATKIVINLGALVTVGLCCYVAWRLSLNGMTFRHFIAGYQVRHKNGRLPNVFTLYAREVVALATGCLVFMKVLLPALMKRGLSAGAGGEDRRHLVQDGNGNLFVTKSVGELRDQQMNAEVQAAFQAAIAKAHTEEWFHDKLFNTAPVMASRMAVLRSMKPAPAPAPKAPPMKKAG